MTVKELIEALSKLSPDRTVMMAGDYYCRYLKHVRETDKRVFLTDEIEYLDDELKHGLEAEIELELEPD